MSKRVQTVGMLLALTSMAIGGSSTAYAGTVTASNAAQNMQQDAACKGVVKDATGEPIIGVSVIVKGTTNGAVTDIDGNFSLANVKKGATLRFTYLGYNPQEVVYNGQPLNITLVSGF